MPVSDSSSPSTVDPTAKGVARTLAEHHLTLLFAFFILLLLYTTASTTASNTIVVLQSASAGRTVQNATTSHQASAPNNSSQGKMQQKNAKIEDELTRREIDHVNKDGPICDLSDPRYDICEIIGDARAIGSNKTIVYVPPAGEGAIDSHEWSIRDQSRKNLEYVGKVTVKSVNEEVAPGCSSRHTIPAVVFAMNGLTSNPWHDFSDVIIPLFITTRAFNGEVQFLVTDLQPWFVDKYKLILKNLSNYDIIDFNQQPDGGVMCYPHIVVGLRSHRDLGIDPARVPGNYTMLDFRMYIRSIYSLPPDASLNIPYKQDQKLKLKKLPRLMLINRGKNRKFVNVEEITVALQAAGFEVVLVEPRRELRIEEFSRVVDSCDVLMGAHGAGLTNFFFLRTNAVMLQVVPWGHMETPSMAFYGVPAREMKLRDVEYSITAQESTLYEKYGKEHPAVSDPESIHRQGWQLGMKYYWLEQDIRLNVTRFSLTLQQVLRDLRE